LSRWCQVQLRRLFRIVNGGTPTADPQNWDGEVRWATPVDLAKVDGQVINETERRLTTMGLHAGSRSVPAGSLLLSTRAPIGYVAQSTREMAFNQGCRGLVPAAKMDIRYFRYQLAALRADLQSLGSGSTFQELSTEALATMRLTNPDAAAQRAIADFLDAETARIDALIEKKRRMLALLDERDFRMIDECFAPRSGEALVRLARFALVQTGITLHEGRTLEGDFVTRPYLRVANVQPGWLDLSKVKFVTVPRAMASRSTLRSGDVLMTEGGDRDKLGRGTVWRGEIPDCLHQNHVFAVRPDPLSLDSEYLGYLTRTSHARAYFEMTGVQSTNLASTSASKVSDFKIPALTIDEQRNRVERYQKFADKNRQISTALTKQLELLTEHRQALITAAVTGEIGVSVAGA
jgi:type I restriction enzyme, S subunit